MDELQRLHGILARERSADDAELVLDFLADLPDLSVWDLRAWYNPNDHYIDQAKLRRRVLEQALDFLLGGSNNYFAVGLAMAQSARAQPSP